MQKNWTNSTHYVALQRTGSPEAEMGPASKRLSEAWGHQHSASPPVSHKWGDYAKGL